MNITVYLGANAGNEEIFSEAVCELGSWIGRSKNRLVYGGSKTGLMGRLAESVLRSQGEVIGVEAQFFMEQNVQMEDLTQLIVTKDITERKTKMIELGDAFIAFPGGTGTLEEITEIMSRISLQQLEAPCIFYNLGGYYDSIRQFLEHMKAKGFSTDERQKYIYFARNLAEIQMILEDWNKRRLP